MITYNYIDYLVILYPVNPVFIVLNANKSKK